MKFTAFALLILSFGASAQTYVQPYINSNGTAVEGYYRRGVTGSSYVGTGSNPNSTYVQPHVTNSGSAVQGHFRTLPDSSHLNNYSTYGNYNPYTGAIGSRR